MVAKNMGRLYDTKEWKNIRHSKLQKNPVCEYCNQTANLEIDHICDHNNNIDLFLDIDNLQTLCHHHHSQKTLYDGKVKNLNESNDKFIIVISDDNKLEKKLDSYVLLFGNILPACQGYAHECSNKLIIHTKFSKSNIYMILRTIILKNKVKPLVVIENQCSDYSTKWIEALLDNWGIKHE